MKQPHPPIETLRRVYDYDSGTGVFLWLRRPSEDFPSLRIWRGWNTRFAGRRADSLRVDGYRALSLKHGGAQHLILAHRLAWAFYHGQWPDAVIDHRDQDRGNNRIANLRAATRSQNGQNTFRKPTRGVWWDATRRQFEAYVMVDRKKIHLGRYFTQAEARAAYEAGRARHHPFRP